jgi:hypothetical protein
MTLTGGVGASAGEREQTWRAQAVLGQRRAGLRPRCRVGKRGSGPSGEVQAYGSGNGAAGYEVKMGRPSWWACGREKGRAGQKSGRKGKVLFFFFSNFPKPF